MIKIKIKHIKYYGSSSNSKKISEGKAMEDRRHSAKWDAPVTSTASLFEARSSECAESLIGWIKHDFSNRQQVSG